MIDYPGLQSTYGSLPGPGGSAYGGTYRRWGIILEVRISYSNTYRWWSPSPVQYTYSVSRIKNAEFGSTDDVVIDPTYNTRLKMIRDGVHVYFIQVGRQRGYREKS